MTDGKIETTITGGQIQGIAGAGTVIIENFNINNPAVEARSAIESDAEEIPPCPYPGLSYFGPNEASVFFGREKAIARLIEAISRQNLIALLGASGSGKSSVVLAGLAPRLHALGNWRFSHFRIGIELEKNPFLALSRAVVPLYVTSASATDRLKNIRELATSLESGDLTLRDVFADCRNRNKDTSILLIADQFEEAFVVVEDESLRNRFIDVLLAGFPDPAHALGHHICLVLTMRADFCGLALRYRPFADALQDHTENLGPMSRDELHAAITCPAETMKRSFEAGLVETLLDSVQNNPGTLPLLQFALREMWGQQKKSKITWKGYNGIGGVEGALARRAEAIYSDLTLNGTNKETEKLFQRLFTRLVTLGESQEDTRRVVERQEIGEDAWSLAQRLADEKNRLVVTNAPTAGRETAELAHEALIRHWPRMVGWIAQDRVFQSWVRHIRPNVVLAKANPSDESPLLRGSMLVQAKDWLSRRLDDLNPAERWFIEASITAEEQHQRQALLDEQRLREAEAKAEQERDAAAKLQVELDKLKDLYLTTGTSLVKLEDETVTEEFSQSTDVAQPGPVPASPPTWAVAAVRAETSRFTGKGCVVAVFGTGIDSGHPAFRGIKLIQKDFTGTGNGDRHGHSTHTAGAVFGRDIDNSRFGIATGVTKALIAKVLNDAGSGQEDAILAGLKWVLDEGCDVICLPMSIDYPSAIISQIEAGAERTVAISNGLRKYLQLLRVYEKFGLVASSVGKGAVIITPAGNESRPNARAPVTSPLSVAQGVLSVGAVANGPDGYTIAEFSNVYPTLCAPGADVLSAYPGGGLRSMTGTSMACAVAAGVAALWWEYLRTTNPSSEITSQMVMERIVKRARTNVFARDVQEFERGAGLIQAPR